MMGEVLDLDLADIKNGYRHDDTAGSFVCLFCAQSFAEGEVYPADGRFLSADGMMRFHIQTVHGGSLSALLEDKRQRPGLTEKQKMLWQFFHDGLSDRDIAARMGVAQATIRHQRFVFREKARQAKLLLAIYELALDRKGATMEIHKGATMVDNRYDTTATEEEKILRAYFSSREPLQLKTFPSRDKKKLVILRQIASQFSYDQHYGEPEVNQILKAIFPDFSTIRRFLVEYGFLARTRDCRDYWRV